MLAPRRYLPSISLLSAFEVAARTQSFTKAAQELHLTQSAVSRQIKALEEQIGVTLFTRVRQTVELTAAGESYAADVREALHKIGNASMQLQVNPQGGVLNIAVLPTLGSRWLAPRLSGFQVKKPGVTVNITTRLSPFDINAETFDAAIHFGPLIWPDVSSAFLMYETVLPVCSPDFLESHRFSCVKDLLCAPLIHLSSRPDAWMHWCQAQGAPAEDMTGMIFDQFATAAQAAQHGLGVALLPEFLIKNELHSGALVSALDLPLKSEDAYYLVWPQRRSNYPPLAAFREWIVEAAKE